MKKITFLFCILMSVLWLGSSNAAAQNDSMERLKELIQFTGIIITPDSLQAVGDVNIRISGTSQGSISNQQGYFAVVAKRRDTLIFSAVGYRSVKYIVPYELTGQKYTMIQTMSQDTLYLNEVVVKPYISKELFQHYFVMMEVPGEEDPLAGMDPETIRELAYSMELDGTANSKYYLRQESGKYYYTGQMVPINLMNPFAWAQFIKSWKEGKLKIQK
ncbi:MAG: carboxypeptidase-like regulatory domain-containing protein [Bacteroidia bacterium]